MVTSGSSLSVYLIRCLLIRLEFQLSKLGDSICAELAKARDLFGERRSGGLRLGLLSTRF
jgi:hypothetical protein